MFNFKVDQNIIIKAETLVSKYNFGKRSKANGNKEQQIVGIIGELMIRDLFNAGEIDGSSGFDGGFDIKYNKKLIDVKTMGRTSQPKKNYVNNLIDLQINHSADHFIFNSFNKKNNILTVCGWISKSNFIKLAKYFPKNTIRKRTDGTEFKTFSGLYELQNKDLNGVYSPDELLIQLK